MERNPEIVRMEKLKDKRRKERIEELERRGEAALKAQAEFNPVAFLIEGITDRDAPSLYGENPERDLYALWKDKTDLTDGAFEEVTPANGYIIGKTRAAFAGLLSKNEKYKDVMLRIAFGQSEEMPFIRMAVDGYDSKNKILTRIVLQESEDFLRSQDKAAPIQTRISRRHWVELQHAMIVAKLDSAFFVSVHHKAFAFTEVKRDDVFCSNHVAECIQFWDHVRRGQIPAGAVVPTGEEA